MTKKEKLEVKSMTKWTKEQQEAIYTSGTNIIVSAGAGSGKTAVLTERVLEKVKNVNISKLSIDMPFFTYIDIY